MMQEIRVKGKAARIRGATWTHDQVIKLFEVWTQPEIYHGLLNEKKKLDIFKRMATTLETLGVQRTWTECRAKIKNLKADFRKAIEKKTQFRYFTEMRKIMNVDGSSTKTLQYFGFKSDRESEGDEDTNTAERSDQDSRSEHGDKTDKPQPGTSAATAPHSSFPQITQHEEFITASPHYSRHSSTTSPYQKSDSEYQGSPGRDTEDVIFTTDQEHDSSSRSSMVITHVVSKVVEPITTVIMPATNRELLSAPPPIPESISPIQLEQEHNSFSDQPPIRLEFVLDESANVVLQTSSEGEVMQEEIFVPPPHQETEKKKRVPPQKTSPILKQRLIKRTLPSPSPSKRGGRLTTTPSLLSTSRPKKMRRTLFPDPSKDRKRKLLDTLNKNTIETISSLLNDSSRCLLKELQDAEQRFISWEEEKRADERKREETMFTKLIGAMRKTSLTMSEERVNADPETVNLANDFAKDFENTSKRLNELVADEVKATEETIRQWEVKMQRQESRHTEKLFAMIINAIKTPSLDLIS